MHTVQDLDYEMHAHISLATKEEMVEWVDWFIKFPTFTYICMYGYNGHPAMMPRYPSDKVVFMEFLWQLVEVHSHLHLKFRRKL